MSDRNMSEKEELQITMTLKQYEEKFLQPNGAPAKGDLHRRFGNPTPLGIAGFLMALTPLSICLMEFGSANFNSAVVLTGAFYTLGGVCLFIAGIQEWILGNTFPALVFTSFAGFYTSFAVIEDPSVGITASFSANGNSSTLGQQNPLFADGVAIYMICWGFLTFTYLLGSLRTNMAFVILFFTLMITFFLVAAAYFAMGNGRNPSSLFKAAGALGFTSTLSGWWIMIALVCGSTGVPIPIPLGDLSTFMAKKKE